MLCCAVLCYALLLPKQFSNDSVERLRRNPVKTLQRFDVVQLAPDHVRLEVNRRRWGY